MSYAIVIRAKTQRMFEIKNGLLQLSLINKAIKLA